MATGGIGSPGAAPNGYKPFRLTFEAHGSPAPKGNFTFTRSDGSFTADVTCYSESGNEAGFSGPITRASGIFTGDVGMTAFVGAQDNGQGRKATGPDKVQVDINPMYAAMCTPSVFPYPVTSGNLVVH